MLCLVMRKKQHVHQPTDHALLMHLHTEQSAHSSFQLRLWLLRAVTNTVWEVPGPKRVAQYNPLCPALSQRL